MRFARLLWPIVGALVIWLAVLAMRGGAGANAKWMVAGAQVSSACLGMIACVMALRGAHLQSERARTAWMIVAASGIFFLFSCFANAAATRAGASVSFVDVVGMLGQPLLFGGLLLLAWRGEARELARLLFDSLIVALSIWVLSRVPFGNSAPILSSTKEFCIVGRDLGRGSVVLRADGERRFRRKSRIQTFRVAVWRRGGTWPERAVGVVVAVQKSGFWNSMAAGSGLSAAWNGGAVSFAGAGFVRRSRTCSQVGW
jgi:hypothetical protein